MQTSVKERIMLILRYLLAILAFWACIFLLPSLVNWWNYISPFPIVPGTWGFVFFTIALQPSCAMFACFLFDKIMLQKGYTVLVVNATIACIVFLFSLYLSYRLGLGWPVMISQLLTVFGLIRSCIGVRRKNTSSESEKETQSFF